MISAASGQAASLGLLAYKAAESDGGAQPPGPGQIRDRLAAAQAASNPSEDSAVKLTLSQDALDHIAQLPSPPSVADRMFARLGVTLQEGQDPEAAAQQYFDDKSKQGHLRGEISMLNVRINLQARARDQLRHNQDEYNRVLNTKPVPRQELSGKEKDAAVKLMENLGYQWPGKGQNRMFAVDNTMYLFKGDDGSVWTNQGDIPVSDEHKQFWLGHLSERIGEGQRDMSDVISNRDAMQAQHDALAAKYAPPARQ